MGETLFLRGAEEKKREEKGKKHCSNLEPDLWQSFENNI